MTTDMETENSSRSLNRERTFAIIMVIGSTLFTFVSAEIVFRLAIFSETVSIEKFRQADLYADPWLDDDYWKLTYAFRTEEQTRAQERRIYLHDVLGWSPAVTEDNPLGIVTDQSYDIDDLAHPILFFGDSYVDGPEPTSNKLPQLLDPLIQARPVLNYGVSGYGVGQIYLRFLDAVKIFDDPVVLIGIQDRDIDRTILSFRNRQKPRLQIEGDELIAENLPITNADDWLLRNPVELKSYFFRFIAMRLRKTFIGEWIDPWLGYDARQDDKLAVNYRILEGFREEAARSEIPLYVVLFYVESDMRVEEWREQFLKQSLNELEIPYFDTKTYLLDHLREAGGDVSDYWSNEHGHPNRSGNELFARGIASWLEAQYPESTAGQ